VGAGGAKFAAAMAPFIVPGDYLLFLTLFAAVLIGSWLISSTIRIKISNTIFQVRSGSIYGAYLKVKRDPKISLICI
jgi:hypothetical protein